MVRARCLAFDGFCLDMLDERLWRDGVTVALGQKAFGVLARLAAQPNLLVTKDELLASVWPDTAVGEAVLTTAIRDIRTALDDSSRSPRYIQTVYGRGYRFIAPVIALEQPPESADAGGGAGVLAGRETELTRLREWYAAALQGHRRIGCIGGEAGIGKTALVDAFLSEIASAGTACVGRGQSVEQYGAGEAYLPILEALERLGRDSRLPLIDTLHRHAPSWLAHLPGHASSTGVPSPSSARPARMLRELSLALEALTQSAPLVLVLEDLHWSDTATLEWLASAARRREAARLLVVGTYRIDEALFEKTALRNVLAELRHLPQSGEIVLDGLSGDAVRVYLQRKTERTAEVDDLADTLHRRTGGHPLFLASIVDELIGSEPAAGAAPHARDLLASAHAMPPNVRRFIEHRIERLSEEDRTLLEAAGTAGDPFSVAAVAAATGRPESEIEARCAAWARAHRLLVADGMASWPDGTLAARYRFRHALFHEAAYARISPERKARLHRLVGHRLEAAYGSRASAIAGELAVHFEQGRDAGRAAGYLEQSALNALSRSAYAEAHQLLTRALTMAECLPDGPERLQREATVLLLLAHVLETTRGWSDDDVERCFVRARERCVALNDEPRLLQSTWGLIAVNLVRGQHHPTRALSRELLALAKKRGDVVFRMAAHVELGGTMLMLADTRSSGRHFHLADVLSTRIDESTIAAFGMDLAVFGRMWGTHLLWYHGEAVRARAVANQVLARTEALPHPFTRTVTLAYAAMLHQFCLDLGELDRSCASVIALATEHGFAYYLAWAEVLRGWSRVAQGAGESAVADMRRGIETMRISAGLRLPYYRALLAEACGRIGLVDEGLRALAIGFDEARTSGEQWWLPELHRTRGELLRQRGRHDQGESEQCVRTAIELARRLRATALERRAASSLSYRHTAMTDGLIR